MRKTQQGLTNLLFTKQYSKLNYSYEDMEICITFFSLTANSKLPVLESPGSMDHFVMV